MRNICMKVSYKGTAYNGFQSQPKGRTIQDELENAIRGLTGENIKIIASGRTDAGVHARSQVFNFVTSSTIELKRWCLALNNKLPEDIVLIQAFEVPMQFHARKAARRKTYHYYINHSRYPDPFHQHMQLHHPVTLNIDAMKAALPYLLGEHDFTSFCSKKSTKQSHVRRIYEARLEVNPSFHTEQGKQLCFIFTGNGFLYHMIRIIIGTLLKIGTGKLASEDMERILLSHNRSNAGPTASAKGLVLWDLEYDE